MQGAAHELRLRLDANQGYFLEWYEGDQVLNSDIYGLVDYPTENLDGKYFTGSVNRADAKFRHLIEEAQNRLRAAEEELFTASP